MQTGNGGWEAALDKFPKVPLRSSLVGQWKEVEQVCAYIIYRKSVYLCRQKGKRVVGGSSGKVSKTTAEELFGRGLTGNRKQVLEYLPTLQHHFSPF